MTWKQACVIALLFGLVAAGLVWWLEGFERERMATEWRAWLDEWGAKAEDARDS